MKAFLFVGTCWQARSEGGTKTRRSKIVDGLTFFCNRTKSVFDGSGLDKEFSAKCVLKTIRSTART